MVVGRRLLGRRWLYRDSWVAEDTADAGHLPENYGIVPLSKKSRFRDGLGSSPTWQASVPVVACRSRLRGNTWSLPGPGGASGAANGCRSPRSSARTRSGVSPAAAEPDDDPFGGESKATVAADAPTRPNILLNAVVTRVCSPR